MAKAPKDGSRAGERAACKSPAYVLQVLKSLAAQAAKGDKQAAADLADYVATHPELKPTVRELDALTDKVETAWIRAVSFGDALTERAARDEVAGMKAELLAPDATILK